MIYSKFVLRISYLAKDTISYFVFRFKIALSGERALTGIGKVLLYHAELEATKTTAAATTRLLGH